MKAPIFLLACALPLAACNKQPQVNEKDASVAEVAEKVRKAGADQAMVREGGQQPLADPGLDGRIGLGHERPVGLGLDVQVAAEVVAGQLVGLVACRLGDVQPATRPTTAAGGDVDRGRCRCNAGPGRGRVARHS